MAVIDELKQEEGFSGDVYIDTEGYNTIGYGTKLPLSKYEAAMLLDYRLDLVKKEVKAHLAYLEIKHEAWSILYMMGYQMGVPGLLRFKKMLKALKEHNYAEASRQILDSRFAVQTPNRAKRLAAAMYALA